MIDLEELERLAKAATQLPWEVDDCNNIRIAPKGRPIVATIHDYEDYLPRMGDASYIVAACNAVPELIAENIELKRQRTWLAEQLTYVCKCYDHYNQCGLDCPNPDWECESTTVQQWMERAKEAMND